MSTVRRKPFISDPIERFWSNVDKSGECWVWTASGRGYPGRVYGVITIDKVTWGTHRLSYVMHYGPIPDGLHICHHCDNSLCVRPDHLYAGTREQNMQDKVRRGRCNAPKGERNNLAKLTEPQVVEIRERFASGGIGCVELASEYGVVRTEIGMIIRGVTWKHAGGPISLRPFIRSNTGYRGVSFSKTHGNRFQAYIGHERKRTPIGLFDDAETAARVYDEYARRLHGDKAILNFPDEEVA